MCEEESDDHEAVAKLLEINDSIHRTIERYKLIKKGDIEAASKIPKGTLGTSGAGVSKGPNNELSLIDLGGPEDSEPSAAQPVTTASKSTSHALEDDLLGLSIGDSNTTGPGAISLGIDDIGNFSEHFNLEFISDKL
jgi:ADP-ribosylation factor-binding protein GGA